MLKIFTMAFLVIVMIVLGYVSWKIINIER
jgi:hypothetical protein